MEKVAAQSTKAVISLNLGKIDRKLLYNSHIIRYDVSISAKMHDLE